MKTSIIVKSIIGAAGLAALLAGPALAQRGAATAMPQESIAGGGQASAGLTRAQTLAQGTNRVYGTTFDSPAPETAAAPGFAPTAQPSNSNTSWQFGPWIGRYPEGN